MTKKIAPTAFFALITFTILLICIAIGSTRSNLTIAKSKEPKASTVYQMPKFLPAVWTSTH